MKNINILRTIRKMSQWDLSDETGIRNYRLSHIERGRFKPRPEELKAIAKALDVSVETLTTNDSKILAALEGEVANA